MRIAVCLKGVFAVNYVYNNTEMPDEYRKNLKETINNNKITIINDLKDLGHDVDVFISTYETFATPILEEEYKPVSINKFPREKLVNTPGGNWNAIFIHVMKLTELVENYEKEHNFTYDLVVVTRLDLQFYQLFREVNLDFTKFNITTKHLSGNCDDSFNVFPRQYLRDYYYGVLKSLNTGGISHELNHRLVERGVPITYMYDLTQEDYDNKTCYKLFCYYTTMPIPGGGEPRRTDTKY